MKWCTLVRWLPADEKYDVLVSKVGLDFEIVFEFNTDQAREIGTATTFPFTCVENVG